MYLKEIVTSGFKSFADKLDIKLDGKITCIVGPNGSGKTTLLKCINRILEAKDGAVTIGEKDVLKMKYEEVAKKIAYVPQML